MKVYYTSIDDPSDDSNEANVCNMESWKPKHEVVY